MYPRLPYLLVPLASPRVPLERGGRIAQTAEDSVGYEPEGRGGGAQRAYLEVFDRVHAHR